MAAIPPVSAARSVSARMRSFAAAENVRRRDRGESSGDAADGGGTVVGLRASLWPAAFFSPFGPSVLGITTISLLCPSLNSQGPVSHRHWHRGIDDLADRASQWVLNLTPAQARRKSG